MNYQKQIIEDIGEHFGVNSLVLEDLMSPTQLSKIEVYEDYVFIILKHLDSDVATFFIPLTFIAGIYGMNFKSMPELEAEWGYPIVLLVMAGVGIAMFLYFKFRRWL